jgi:endonuclease/exonuclease/phosphatase family metal-dependent hydrolase
MQLDHLLVRGRLTLEALRVGPLGPSDHLPLSATVRPLPATGGRPAPD